MVNSIFLYMLLLFDLRGEGKMTTYPILTFMQSLIKFQSVVPKIQMKRAKRDILTYIHTFILTYILTNQVIESAISSLKIRDCEFADKYFRGRGKMRYLRFLIKWI